MRKVYHREERRSERIDKGERHKKHQRRATESLRRIQTIAKNFRNGEEYADDLDELYDDE